jgi:hypothetical protein
MQRWKVPKYTGIGLSEYAADENNRAFSLNFEYY